MGIAVAVSLLTAPAFAQKPPPPPPAAAATQLVPPKLLQEAPAKYPEGATGEATVIVEILVDLDGTVSDTRVADGDEPFASEAVEAAKKCRFEPARRGAGAIAPYVRASRSPSASCLRRLRGSASVPTSRRRALLRRRRT